MACHWRDSLGRVWFCGRTGGRLRARARREGLYAWLRLQTWHDRGRISLHPVSPRNFPHQTRFRDACRAHRRGYQYHVTLYPRALTSPQARAALNRIRAFFQNQDWCGVLGVYRIAMPGHTAVLRLNNILSPRAGAIRFLRSQYGLHPGAEMTVSM